MCELHLGTRCTNSMSYLKCVHACVNTCDVHLCAYNKTILQHMRKYTEILNAIKMYIYKPLWCHREWNFMVKEIPKVRAYSGTATITNAAEMNNLIIPTTYLCDNLWYWSCHYSTRQVGIIVNGRYFRCWFLRPEAMLMTIERGGS